jgi:hypothetical protein
MNLHSKGAVAVVALLSTFNVLAQESTCSRVYADAVRNISVEKQQLAVKSRVFSENCETNGSLKQTNAGADLTIPLKAIKIGFSGDYAAAKQEMQSFCREFSSRHDYTSNEFSYTNMVSTEALKSLNECVALEQQGIQITHQMQDPSSFIVNVKFNPSTTKLNFTGFKQNNVVCDTTTVDKSKRNLTSIRSEFKPKGNFSIQCKRSGLSKRGQVVYERASLGIATNLGSYSVILPPEGLLGYDLANQNRIRDLDAQSRINSLQDSLSKTEAKLENVAVQVYYVRQGDGDAVACPQRGGNIQQYMTSVCGSNKVAAYKAIPLGGGGTCGYAAYAFACLVK